MLEVGLIVVLKSERHARHPNIEHCSKSLRYDVGCQALAQSTTSMNNVWFTLINNNNGPQIASTGLDNISMLWSNGSTNLAVWKVVDFHVWIYLPCFPLRETRSQTIHLFLALPCVVTRHYNLGRLWKHELFAGVQLDGTTEQSSCWTHISVSLWPCCGLLIVVGMYCCPRFTAASSRLDPLLYRTWPVQVSEINLRMQSYFDRLQSFLLGVIAVNLLLHILHDDRSTTAIDKNTSTEISQTAVNSWPNLHIS